MTLYFANEVRSIIKLYESFLKQAIV